MIKEVAFIGYPVTDIPRARAFYEGVLGLKASLAHEVDPAAGTWWMGYDIAGVALAVSNAWPPSGQSGPGAALEVDRIDDVLQKLQSQGVTVTYGPMDSPVCRFFGIKDPDGNDLTIHQRKAGCSPIENPKS